MERVRETNYTQGSGPRPSRPKSYPIDDHSSVDLNIMSQQFLPRRFVDWCFFSRWLLLLSVCAPIIGLFALTGAVDRAAAPIDIGLKQIVPSTFEVQIELNGVVEPMASTVARSECYWSTTILSIVPEGTWVQKGDVVCVLDSSEVEDYARSREVALIKYRGRLDNALHDQKILSSQNERRLTAAKNKYQSAEYELNEYSSGTLPQQLAEMEQDLTMLAAQVETATDEIRHVERMWAMGLVKRPDMEKGTLDLIQAQEKHRVMEAKLNLLTEFTNPRNHLRLSHRRTEAQRDVARVALTNSLAVTKSSLTTLSYERTLRIYERYQRRALDSIKACTIRAPCDGQVMYGNSWYLMSRGITNIAEGSRVRRQQKVFEIPDPLRLKVSLPLNEALIYQVHEGMSVNVKLAGYEDIDIAGTIAKIPRYPRSRSSYTPDQKDYWLDIELLPTDEQRELITTKADATVEIVVTRTPDALQVPRTAITGVADDNFLYVFDGKELQTRKVELGAANSENVCVLSGLEAGEMLVTEMTPQHRQSLEAALKTTLDQQSHTR